MFGLYWCQMSRCRTSLEWKLTFLRLHFTEIWKYLHTALTIFLRKLRDDENIRETTKRASQLNINRKIYSLTASHGEFGSLALLFLRHDLRYVRILFLALSANSGNCLVHESIMAWIFSLGCLLIGTIRSRFSSTNSLTNIYNKKIVIRHWCS